jgi:hypothetical protein
MYGKYIDVYTETFSRLTPEFLVHVPTLVAKMEERGLHLKESHLFSHSFNEILKGGKKMPAYFDVQALQNDPVQTQFSFLNRWMVFEKHA